MLVTLDSGREIDYTTHVPEWRARRVRLGDAQWQEISDELNRRIDGAEVHTARWIPGRDWNGTVFQAIHDVACGGNTEAAALYFGLAVWQVIRERPERWSFGRYEKDGIPIRSLTYFRLGP